MSRTSSQLGTILSLSLFLYLFVPSRTTHRHYNSISSQFNYGANDVTTSELQAVKILGFPRIDGTLTDVIEMEKGEKKEGKKEREIVVCTSEAWVFAVPPTLSC